jgi:hypothetical protein
LPNEPDGIERHDDNELRQPRSSDFFSRLLGHDPDKDQSARFNQIAKATKLEGDDGMWYYIFINEFYDERLKKRLEQMDKVSDLSIQKTEEGVKKTVRKILENMSEETIASFKQNLENIAAHRSQWEALRSWGILIASLAAFFAVAFNAGYVMGAGNSPFWFHPKGNIQWFFSLFFLVPSGWVIFLGGLPYAFYTLKSSLLGLSDKSSKIFKDKTLDISVLYDFTALVFKMLASVLIIGFSCLFFSAFWS